MTVPGLEILLDEAGIGATVGRVAADLSARVSDGVVLAAVLRGSVPFLADLARAMSVRPLIDFLAITPCAEHGEVRLLKDLDIDISGREVVIVEDIVDTGLTTAFIQGELARRDPARLLTCTFVDRPARRVVPVELDVSGHPDPRSLRDRLPNWTTTGATATSASWRLRTRRSWIGIPMRTSRRSTGHRVGSCTRSSCWEFESRCPPTPRWCSFGSAMEGRTVPIYIGARKRRRSRSPWMGSRRLAR
ncbi:MAG: phosphoribosyltransferase family protein [Acidimicrobiales bacterium]